MPHVSGRVRYFWGLLQQVRRWNALPRAGGLDDQEADTMSWLTFIANEIDSEAADRQRAREFNERSVSARPVQQIGGLDALARESQRWQ